MSPVVWVFLYFVAHALTPSVYGKRRHPSLAEYPHHPLSVHGISGSGQSEQIQRYEGDRNLGVNFVEVLRAYIKTNPNLIDRVLGDISHKDFSRGRRTDDTWECPNQGPTLCSTESPPLTKDDIGTSNGNDIVASLRRKWKRVERKLVEDPEECESCITLWQAVQELACAGDSGGWETVRDVIIVACELAFQQSGLDPVMCNGTITLQGQHVYCVVMEADPRDLCESLNNCYPAEDRDRPPVSERTPWAVKEQGRKGGNARVRTPATRATRATDGLVMVAQLTDIHVQHNHVIGAHHDCNAYICCLEDSMGTGSARTYGEYSCNLPPRTLDLFLHRVQESHPDFVIYAGDSPPHTIWDETLQSQLNCSQTVADAMQKAFDEDLRVYANIGNHEMYPTNLYSLRLDETKHMTEEFTRMWHRFGGFDGGANMTMATMGYYTTTVPGHDKVRIMSINTNYDWYNMNFFNVLNQHTAENEQHQAWIIDTLTTARTNNERVIVIGHCPVGGPDAHVRSARWWEDIAKAYSDVIILHVSGHTHRDHFKLSFDHDSMDAKTVNLVVASTTSNTNINPTMRMYYLDPENGYSLVDFESFYMDIKTQNESMGVPPAIAFSYSALDAYGMPDMSPNSWKELVLRFIDDDDLFQAYYKNIRSHARDTVCDYDCKVDIVCNLWFGEMSEVDECKLFAPEAPPTEPPVTVAPEPGGGIMLSHSLCAIVLCGLISVITN